MVTGSTKGDEMQMAQVNSCTHSFIDSAWGAGSSIMLKETAVPRCLCTDRRCLGRLDPQVHRMSMANSSEQEDIFWLATKNGGSEQPISEQEHAIQRTTARECYSG